MKNLLTKILFISLLLSTVIPFVVQAGDVNEAKESVRVVLEAEEAMRKAMKEALKAKRRLEKVLYKEYIVAQEEAYEKLGYKLKSISEIEAINKAAMFAAADTEKYAAALKSGKEANEALTTVEKLYKKMQQ